MLMNIMINDNFISFSFITFSMSDFIEIDNKSSLAPLSHEMILKGILSKIEYSKSGPAIFKKGSHHPLLQKNIEQKYELEAQNAKKMYSKSLMVSYK